jgi:hypothetical protein
MNGHGAKFARKREEAVIALLNHRTLEEAARSIEINTQTLFRWTKIPEFAAEYRAARRAAYLQSIARTQQNSGLAVSTLFRVMMEPGTPASTRVRAADSILGHAARGMEIEDIEARVALLELAMASDAKKSK